MSKIDLAKPIPFFTSAIFLALIDQMSKWMVEARLSFQTVFDIAPFLAFYRTHNIGVAFSWFNQTSHLVLALIAAVVCVGVIFLWHSNDPTHKISHIGYAAIIGGALGNLFDRLYHGYVIDFILVYTDTWAFAVFNIADSFVFIGAALVIFDGFFNTSTKDR